MKIMAIYGNPKQGGFVHGCVDAVADHLESRGAEVDRLRLAEANIQDCTGCFACLKTGRCVIDDSINAIVGRIRAADGLICGASVRNGNVGAMFKRFYERITYTIIFTGDVTDKYVLGISAVGFAGGRKLTRRIVAMEEMGARTVDHLYFRTGIPTKKTVEDVRGGLIAAADKLHKHIETQRSPGLGWKLKRWFDQVTVSKCMFRKHPEVYANVIRCWRERGWMK